MENYTKTFAKESDNFDIEHETKMLMYRFLSIVDYIMEAQNISKKELARMIGTSPSYITQLFNGRKLINLTTLAKIQNALDMKFKIDGFKKPEDLKSFEAPRPKTINGVYPTGPGQIKPQQTTTVQ
ncbi:MAG: helix-turn-helix domain-containing protein [Marinirhabdus sp.]